MEQLSSPGTTPVKLADCIEELLNFILHSQINQTLGFDLGLSNEFCSYLLQHDPQDTVSGEVHSDPLYKHLASSLCGYVSSESGGSCNTSNRMASLDKDSDLKERGKWNELVLVEGTNLLDILKTVNFELHVQEPFFTQLKDGLKTVEGRCALGDYNRIGSGASLLFNKCLVLQVQDIHHYASFSDMLEAESLAKVLPGVKTIDEGIKVYRKFYTQEKERANGVLAICVSKSAAQPYIPLARILSGLSYGGLQCLLGGAIASSWINAT